MKKLVTTLFFLTFLIGSNSKLNAQDQEEYQKGTVSIITNPSYFVLGGYHIKPSYHLPKRWSLGATLQGGFELPTFARDQFFNVSNEEIKVDWIYAIGIELKYRFTNLPYDKGFYTSVNIGFEEWEVKDQINDRFDNWFSSLDIGYNWFPFNKNHFHLGVQYTLIFILNNTSDRKLGEETYNIKSVVPPSFAPSIFIGWRF